MWRTMRDHVADSANFTALLRAWGCQTIMRRLSIAVIAASLAVAVTETPMGAQTSAATIAGRVVDQQGGVLPGATVVLIGRTGPHTQITDARGAFRFVGLDVDT